MTSSETALIGLSHPRELVVVVMASIAIASASWGATQSFSDPSAFQTSISGLSTGTLDFESIPADTLLVTAGLTQAAAGTSVGIVFPASVLDLLLGPALGLEVTGLTSPGYNVLGVADPEDFDQLIGGTSLPLGFTQPVLGFGLTVVSADTPGGTLLDGDLELVAAGATAPLVVVDRTALGFAMLVGGGTQEVFAYFVGVTSDVPFTEASLEPGPGAPEGGFFFWADDLVVAVPEPGTTVSLLAGVVMLVLLRRPAG